MQSQYKYDTEPIAEERMDEEIIENPPAYLLSATRIDRLVHTPFIWLGENPFILIALVLAIILSLFLPIPFYILGIGLGLLGWVAQKVLPFESAIPPYLLSYNHAAKYGHEELWDMSEQGLDEAGEYLQAEIDKRERDIEDYEARKNHQSQQEEFSNGIGNVIDKVSNIGDTIGSMNDRIDAFGSLMEGDFGAISDLFASGEKEEGNAADYQQAQGYENLDDATVIYPAPVSLSKEERQQLWYESIIKLKNMIGLEEVKMKVLSLREKIKAIREYEKEGIKRERATMHMIFSGPPGTGKTEVARLLSKLLQASGYLSSGHFIEVQRADLIGEYQGHTAKKVKDIFEKAKGGTLFIDEAYSLKNGEGDGYGKEAIDTIIKYMEDYRTEMVVILAGYDVEMKQLMKTNPGFKSRINDTFRFVDYTPEQLTDLAFLYLTNQDFKVEHVELEIQKAIRTKVRNGVVDGNGRWVRNFVDKILTHQDSMVANNMLADKLKIHPSTIEKAIREMRD